MCDSGTVRACKKASNESAGPVADLCRRFCRRLSLRVACCAQDLLNMRKIQETLAKQKEYAEAHKMKLKADSVVPSPPPPAPPHRSCPLACAFCSPPPCPNSGPTRRWRLIAPRQPAHAAVGESACMIGRRGHRHEGPRALTVRPSAGWAWLPLSGWRCGRPTAGGGVARQSSLSHR